MISGNKINIETKSSWSVHTSAAATSSHTFKSRRTVAAAAEARFLQVAKHLLNEQEHHQHKSTKPIYGAAAVVNQPVFCNTVHNIAMLVEMLGCGLPFVGWRVKPDPGD